MNQEQLDVLGEVFERAWVLREQLGELYPATAEFLVSVADRAPPAWWHPEPSERAAHLKGRVIFRGDLTIGE